MDVKVPTSDELGESTAAARASLAEAARLPEMQREPYRYILAAQSDSLGVMYQATLLWKQATADVIAARDPVPGIVEAVTAGANAAMKVEARRFIRTLDRGLAARIGLAIGGAFVLGAALATGVCWRLGAGPWSADAAWAQIARANPDPRPALAAAETRADRGGRRYRVLSLWVDPPDPPQP